MKEWQLTDSEKLHVITLADACMRGFNPLTVPYLPGELPMLRRAVSHLEQGGIDWALIGLVSNTGVTGADVEYELWRN